MDNSHWLFPQGYFDLNADDNPVYKRARLDRLRSLNDRPAAAIFKIGNQQRKLGREQTRKAVLDTFTLVEDNLAHFRELGELGIVRPFEIDQWDRDSPSGYLNRARRLEQIDLYEYEQEKLDRNIQKRKVRIPNLILGMLQGNSSRYQDRW